MRRDLVTGSCRTWCGRGSTPSRTHRTRTCLSQNPPRTDHSPDRQCSPCTDHRARVPLGSSRAGGSHSLCRRSGPSIPADSDTGSEEARSSLRGLHRPGDKSCCRSPRHPRSPGHRNTGRPWPYFCRWPGGDSCPGGGCTRQCPGRRSTATGGEADRLTECCRSHYTSHSPV